MITITELIFVINSFFPFICAVIYVIKTVYCAWLLICVSIQQACSCRK